MSSLVTRRSNAMRAPWPYKIQTDEDTGKRQTRLIDHLATSLKKTVPGSHTYTLYILSTKLTSAAPLISPKPSANVESTLLSRKLLIFVAERISEKETLVVGAEIHEYHDLANETLTIYVSKVDTTGYRSDSITPTRNLLSAYMSFYSESEERSNKNLSPRRRVVRFHVFARSQPQYLFHLSSKNPTKRVLECSKLVRWWKSILQQNFVSADAQAKNARGWFFIPGVTNERSARMLINDMVSDETEKLENQFWKYGYPYFDTQKAIDVIPRFEDDAKSRWLRSAEDSLTVKEFWYLVSHGGEFAGSQFAGFFWVEVKSNDSRQTLEQGHSEDSIEEIGGLVIDALTYDSALRVLLDQNFESEDAAIKSTLFWKRYFTNLHDGTVSTGSTLSVLVDNPMIKREIQRQQTNIIPINNLQMSIKRKAPSDVKTSIPPPLIKKSKDG
ncbi:18242_t:CDS:2 [Acaulospora morrowiae]|uniref:histone acetyltransferase n=1 Tax=Acaulospora morrowiae TaxID=94023 RepID=A0A9N8VYP4_9GLOM|nr:18242_t:CDS:2 [Acaulospora morrowiae]